MSEIWYILFCIIKAKNRQLRRAIWGGLSGTGYLVFNRSHIRLTAKGGTVEYHDLSHPRGTILRPSLSSEVGQLKDLATLLVAAH